MELITPYAGSLVNLVAEGEEKSELPRRAAELFSVQLTPRTLCDLELLATGAFSPLDRFMGQADAERVAAEMRLAGGTLFPIPVTLSVDQINGFAGQEIALRTPKNNLVGWMKVEEVYEWSFPAEARQVFETNERDSLVAEMRTWGRYRLSGPLRAIELPRHPDFPSLRRTPAEVRALLAGMGRGNVVAFEPRDPIHRAHEETIGRAAREVDGSLLIQPVVGMIQPGNIGHYYTRIRTYKALAEHHCDPHRTLLNLLPLAPRLAGSREDLCHAIVHRNFGASHFLVEDDAARERVALYTPEIGVQAMPCREMVYLQHEAGYEMAAALPPNARTLSLSDAEIREVYLWQGKPLPEWFIRKEIAAILVNSYPPRGRRGFCIWFTGLPSSGKSTVAEALIVMLMEHGRQVTMLDGDVVRTHLSKGLGFTREDRDTNILRIGYVASEIVRHHGAVICAAVSPYRETRNRVRAMMSKDAFIETFVDTPVEICEQRDVKGFYGKARAGQIKGFTGVDDPYESPLNPEITLFTGKTTPQENAERIMGYLIGQGFLLRDTAEIAREEGAELLAAG